MKSVWKKRRLVAGIVFSLLVLSAGAVAAAEEQITLRIHVPMVDSSPAKPVMDYYLDLYQQLNPHIKIENLGREHSPDRLVTMYAAGVIADVLSIDTLFLNEFYRQGMLVPMPTALQERIEQEMFPAVVDALRADGRLFGTPHENMLLGIWYNRTAMAENGIADLPRTYDEFEQLGRRMARYSADGEMLSPGAVVSSTVSYQWEHILLAAYRAEGGRFFDEQGQLAFDEAGMAAVMNRVLDWTTYGGAVPFVNNQWDEFFHGRAGYFFGYPWHYQELQRGYIGDFNDVGTAPLPAGSAGPSTTQYGHGFAVTALSQHPDEAWKLIEWLSLTVLENGATPMGHVMAILGSVPVHRADITSPYVQDTWQMMEGFVAGLEHATNAFQYMIEGFRTETLANYFGDVMVQVIAGETTILEGLHNLVRRVEAYLSR